MSPANEKGTKDLQSLKADWIKKVVRDPGTPAAATTLVGYLGDSAKDGYARVYSDHELTSYVDIPVGDVLHAQRLPEEQSPLGEVIVWVKRDARFVQGTESGQAGGSWFEGPIVTDQYATTAAGAQPYGGGWPGGPGGPVTFPPCGPIPTIPPLCPLPTTPPTACCPITFRPFCPPLTPLCPRTPIRPCFTQAPLCRTVINCPPKSFAVACPTISPACFRTPVIACVTQNIICQTPLCPRTQFCPVTAVCPTTAICPVNTLACPNSAGFVCTGYCPSAVDACPSAPGGCDPWTTVINPVETVVNPGSGTINPAYTVINPGGWTGGMYG